MLPNHNIPVFSVPGHGGRSQSLPSPAQRSVLSKSTVCFKSLRSCPCLKRLNFTYIVNSWGKCVPDVVLRNYSENEVMYTKPQPPHASVTGAGTCIQPQQLSGALYWAFLQLSSLSLCPTICLCRLSLFVCASISVSLSVCLSVSLSLYVYVSVSVADSTQPCPLLSSVHDNHSAEPPLHPSNYGILLLGSLFPSRTLLHVFQTVSLSKLKLARPWGGVGGPDPLTHTKSAASQPHSLSLIQV